VGVNVGTGGAGGASFATGGQGGNGGQDDHQGDRQLGDPRPGHEAQLVGGDVQDRTHPAAASPKRR
jgi:hypothetical protein